MLLLAQRAALLQLATFSDCDAHGLLVMLVADQQLIRVVLCCVVRVLVATWCWWRASN
jgi:hypothetical protein